jgi:hypothetical protein
LQIEKTLYLSYAYVDKIISNLTLEPLKKSFLEIIILLHFFGELGLGGLEM